MLYNTLVTPEIGISCQCYDNLLQLEIERLEDEVPVRAGSPTNCDMGNDVVVDDGSSVAMDTGICFCQVYTASEPGVNLYVMPSCLFKFFTHKPANMNCRLRWLCGVLWTESCCLYSESSGHE